MKQTTMFCRRKVAPRAKVLMDTPQKQIEVPECDIEGTAEDDIPDVCPKVRRIVRVAIAFAMVGTIAVAIGTILPVWLVDNHHHTGIFLTCRNTFQDCHPIYHDNLGSRIGGVLLSELLIGLIISGYLTLLPGLGCLFSFLTRECQDPRRTVLAILASVFLTLAAAFVLASVAVHLGCWLNESIDETSIGFAWYVTIVGVVCLLACVICLLVVVLKYKGSKIEPSTQTVTTNCK